MKCRSSIENWVDSISSLSDDLFFEIIRLYLGDVKTPYNKQRLIEQLAGFIRNEKNSLNMLSLLDKTDLKILSAISYISNATEDTLVDFFESEINMVEIYEAVINLEKRLFIFEQKDIYSPKVFLRINPLVWDKLEPLLNLSNIISFSTVTSVNIDDIFSISPNFLAAFISFINTKGCFCKADGVIKKNSLTRIEQIFPGREKCIQLVLNSFINLNLVKDTEKGFEIDKERFVLFAKMKESEQYALLCAASCSRFSRDGLKKEAQLFLDIVNSIPEQGYSRRNLVKLAFLVGTYSESGNTNPAKSRFSRMLEEARNECGYEPEIAGTIIDRMIDSAIEFGLLQKLGTDEQGDEIFNASKVIKSLSDNENNKDILPNEKVLNIDSTFTVSFMPGLNLEKILPLTDFLEVKSYGIVTEFEITRKSTSLAFDMGWSVDEIIATLEKYTSYGVPQNLIINITEWYSTYSSAMLFKGYVLKVDKKNISFTENNPKINRYIKEKLADGVYLLDIPLDADISIFKEESGLEFLGKVKNADFSSEKISFPLLRTNKPLYFEEKPEKVKLDYSKAGELLEQLKEEVESMDLTNNQKEGLLNKINHRLIVNVEQLKKTSLRSEIIEIDGMDFNGKVHLLNNSDKKDVFEITLPAINKKDVYYKVKGKVVSLNITEDEAYLVLKSSSDGSIIPMTVSQITFIRRLRY